MTARPWMLAVTYSSAALAVACAAEPKQRSGQVGVYRDAGAIAGSSGAAGNVIDSAGVGAEVATAKPASVESSALGVRIQDRQKLTIEVITIACEGDCADIEAVAHGGNPPYGYAWEDGSRDPKRHVCPNASAKLSVVASDTHVSGAEFGYQAQTAHAEVSANVLHCADAGVPPSPGQFCIKNPSFEGTPPAVTFMSWKLPEWTICAPSPDVCPRPDFGMPPWGQAPAASDGSTYLGAGILLEPESGGTAFCAPLEAGQAVSFSVDLGTVEAYGVINSPTLQLWGGTSSCGKDELLWESPAITNVGAWKTYCATFTPTQRISHLRLVPVPSSRPLSTYVIVDNFRSKTSCN